MKTLICSPTLFLAALIVSVGLSSASADDLRVGLVSYWPLDTIAAGTTPDLAYGNNLTVNNSPTSAAGQFGNALTFNGTSQYLGLTHDTDFNVNGLPIYNSPGGYTVAFWVKGAAQTTKDIFAEGNTSSSNPLLQLQSGGSGVTSKLHVMVRTTGGTLVCDKVSNATVFNNAWHHVAWVDNLGAATLYVDGVVDTNFTYTAGGLTLNTTAVGALLRTAGASYFTGSVDDVALWQRPLSQDEVNQVRTNSISTPIPPAIPTLVQPLVPSTNYLGDLATFQAGAVGKLPLSYQWYRDGVPLTGKTNVTLALSGLTAVQTNQITLVVTNSLGALTNSTTLVVVADPPVNVGQSVIAYWPLDEVTNSPAVTPDVYNHNDMALNLMDGSSLVSGQFGNALMFDGWSQFAKRVGGSPIYNTNAYSVAFWIKGGGQSSRTVYMEGSSTTDTPVIGFSTESSGLGSNLVVLVRTDGNTAVVNRKSTGPVFDNNWHHIVWTDVNGRARLYIDGLVDATDFSYTPGSLTLNTTALGAMVRSTTNNFFGGTVDDVAQWSRRLTWTEMQQIRTNGIPAQTSATAPSIVMQPADVTNGVYAGDTVSFSVQALGTAPLSYQWCSNSVPLSALVNASSQSNLLTLAHVHPADATGYSVVITNVAGAITSRVAQLSVIPYAPVTNGEVLKLDFGLSGSPDIQSGFSEWNLSMNGNSFSGVKVTVSPIGGTTVSELQERLRGVNATTGNTPLTNNPPAFTQAALYDDMLMARDSKDGAGLSVLIERLAPNTKYGLTVWSWWQTTAGDNKVTDWIETASGTPVPIVTGYTFDGLNVPTNDYTATFGALLTSSDSGKLLIEGHQTAATIYSTIVNAIELVAQPTIQITDCQLASGNLRLTVRAQYPNQPISIQQKSVLTGGTWASAAGGGVTGTNGPIVTAEFPVGPGPLFYRAVGQ